MIRTNEGINDLDITVVNTEYIGEDALHAEFPNNVLEDIRKYLFKECKIQSESGLIIGFEDNRTFNNYYWIIYLPNSNKIKYELWNNNNFYDTIK